MQDDRQHSAILDVSSALVSNPDPEDALSAVVQMIGEIMDVWFVDVWTHWSEGHAVVFEAFWDRGGSTADDRQARGRVVGLDERPDLRRLIENKETVERHLDDADLPVATRAAMEQRGYRSTLDTPLMLGDQAIGVLGLVETRFGRRFTVDERELLAQLRRFAALAIHNVQLARRRAEHKRHLVSLLESSRSLAASRDACQTIESTRAEIAGLMPWSDCRVDVHLRNDDGTFSAYVPDSCDEDGEPAGRGANKLDSSAGQALERLRPILVRGGERVRLIVPLVFDGEPSGYLDVSGRPTRQITRDEIEYVQILVNHTAVAVENARLCRTVVRQAPVDAVSGLYSRWYFYERLYSETARANRYREPLTLVMCSVDDLERFVGVRGQDAADVVLRNVGRLINSSLRRRVDVACRTGDNEFGILLPNTPCAAGGAALVTERLRKAVKQTEFRDDDHDLLGRFTLTQGVAGFPEHAEDADDLATAAEKALGRAVAAGPNSVKVYRPGS